MKYGIDVHGVADTKKKFFALFSQRAITNGHEVHIITGSRETWQLKFELEKSGIKFTHFFSVADYLIEKGVEVHWADKDNPWFPEDDWNKTKGLYCKQEGIDIHFDDSKTYGKYFETLYMKVI